VVFGTRETIASLLARRGWTIQSAFVERLNLALRQHGAALGRRVHTLCKHAAGWCQQWALCPVDHKFVVPHARLRVALPEPSDGTASVKPWQPLPPA
jgi:hypothetical protein